MGTMSPAKRAWKLQENVAHGSNVTCLALGSSSGRVMVTGGEDRKVNMWAIGKPNVIMSLSGHTSPVECVQFNGTEELVVAGSKSGTLKIWDLEAAKIVRTLTGHKSNIRSLDFHPYGDFVASGSLDTNIKLWDVRRKGCIFTYKGHVNAVNHLRFSPDGRWVVSGGEDSLVKLWDLTAGKILTELKLHKAAVNRVEFHPREFLLATCSSDRTVKFWDLETFDMISSTEVEQSAVRSIQFHPEGICLFSGAQDSLRIYGWEPSKCYESHALSWGKVADIAFSSNQLIGASFYQTNVSVWVVDLRHLETVVNKADQESAAVAGKGGEAAQPGTLDATTTATRKTSPQRKSFNTRPRTTSSKPRKSEKPDEDVSEAPAQKGKDDIPIDLRYEQVFSPREKLRRSPTADVLTPEPFQAPTQEAPKEQAPKPDPVKFSKAPAASYTPAPVQINTRIPLEPQPVESIAKPSAAEAKPSQTTTRPNQMTSRPNQVTTQLPTKEPTYPSFPTPSQQPSPFVPPISVSEVPNAPQHRTPYQAPYQAPAPLQENKVIETPRAPTKLDDKYAIEKRGVNMEDFMPAVQEVEQSYRRKVESGSIDEEKALLVLKKSHNSICTIMNTRLKNLSIVSQPWFDGEIKTAVQTAATMPDQAILVDLLNVLTLKQTMWNLDICVVVLPQLKEMLTSKYESYVETACNAVRLVLKSFAPVIKSNMAAPPISMGVDLVREERYRKCHACRSHLLDIYDVVSKRTQSSGKHGALYKHVALALNSILD